MRLSKRITRQEKKTLFELLETEYGRYLTKAEKKAAVFEVQKIRNVALEMDKLFEGALPEKSFAEWAEENEIDLNKDSEKPLKQSKETRFCSLKNLFTKLPAMRWLASAAAGVILCLAVTLPIIFWGGAKSTPISEEKLYTDEITSIRVTKEIVYGINGLLLFKYDQIFGEPASVTIDFATEDNLILGYSLSECLIVLSDGENAFIVDYRIRTHKGYNFIYHEHYYGEQSFIDNSFTLHNIEVSYGIKSNLFEPSAYICFSYNNCDYFLAVRSFENVTEITADNLKNLLITDLFSNLLV